MTWPRVQFVMRLALGFGLVAAVCLSVALSSRAAAGGDPVAAGAKGWPGAKTIARLLKKAKRGDDFEQFVADYNRLVERFAHPHRLSMVEQAQADPLALPDLAFGWTETAHEQGATTISAGASAFEAYLHPLGVEAGSDESTPLAREGEPSALPALLQGRLEEVVERVHAAYSGMKPSGHAFLVEQAPVLTDQFLKHIYLESEESNYAANCEAIALGGKIDLGELGAALRGLGALWEPGFTRAWEKNLKGFEPPADLTAPGVEGTVLLVQPTDHGMIVIGGDGPNEYELEAAIIIDLGGDDTYRGRPGSARPPGLPVSLIIDLSGNDTYLGEDDAVGAGVGGIGIVVDLAGDDLYKAGRRSIGCGVFGVGAVIDGAGDDEYAGAEYTQGAALFGVGLVADHAGDDTYKADLYAQGFGMPRAVGVLWDGAGKDAYACTDRHPSVYGDEGEFNGMGQGIGIGLRGMQKGGLGAGGIGALLDGGGDDAYRCGQFGLGCGYYFGLGIVRDRGGDDDYEASRYGLATGAHYALGIVMDDGGDDRYRGRGVANQAGNWDLTISYLIDGGGDDRYEAPGLSQGSATITSLAVLCDAGGSDEYRSGASNVQGHGGHKTDADRKTRSFGFLMDFGKGKDRFESKFAASSQPRKNGVSNVKVETDGVDGPEVGLGFFLDTSKKMR